MARVRPSDVLDDVVGLRVLGVLGVLLVCVRGGLGQPIRAWVLPVHGGVRRALVSASRNDDDGGVQGNRETKSNSVPAQRLVEGRMSMTDGRT